MAMNGRRSDWKSSACGYDVVEYCSTSPTLSFGWLTYLVNIEYPTTWYPNSVT